MTCRRIARRTRPPEWHLASTLLDHIEKHTAPKLARTIADLAGAETITAIHAAEVLRYRARKPV